VAERDTFKKACEGLETRVMVLEMEKKNIQQIEERKYQVPSPRLPRAVVAGLALRVDPPPSPRLFLSLAQPHSSVHEGRKYRVLTTWPPVPLGPASRVRPILCSRHGRAGACTSTRGRGGWGLGGQAEIMRLLVRMGILLTVIMTALKS
jgi:hypothetical protein